MCSECNLLQMRNKSVITFTCHPHTQCAQRFISISCGASYTTSRLYVGASAKLRKATVSFVMSVCLSVRMKQLDFHLTDVYEIWYLITFRHSVEKIQVSLKYENKNGYFARRPESVYKNMSLNSS
jgi:hypothetical protein